MSLFHADINICTNLCPCGSGLLIINCCFASKGLFVPTAWEVPKSPIQTFYQNAECYASPLCDCTDRISREHYITQGILHRLNQHKSLRVQGFPWLAGKTIDTFSPKALTGKMLCARHNTALSGLDAIALRLFDALDAVANKSRIPEQCDEETFVFNGHDLERWLLKVLCGMLASSNLSDKGQAVVGRPDPLWVKILFQGLPFPKHWGLYFKGVPGDTIHSSPGIGVIPLGDALSPASPEAILGVVVLVRNFQFILHLASVPPDRYPEGSILSDCTYRPMSLTFHSGGAYNAIVFGWNEPVEPQHLNISLMNLTDTENNQLNDPSEV